MEIQKAEHPVQVTVIGRSFIEEVELDCALKEGQTWTGGYRNRGYCEVYVEKEKKCV
jgi:hypothetical protein